VLVVCVSYRRESGMEKVERGGCTLCFCWILDERFTFFMLCLSTHVVVFIASEAK